MNGTTAHIMRNLDNCYKTNYGLSLQHIRDVANLFTLTEEDCDELWNTQWREMMIIAIICLGNNRATTERLLRWAETVPSQEIVENIGFLLTGRAPQAPEIAKALAERDQNMDTSIALHTAARALMARQQNDAWLPIINSIFTTCRSRELTSLEIKATSFLCRQCARSKFALSQATDFANWANESNNTKLTMIYEEFIAERESE